MMKKMLIVTCVLSLGLSFGLTGCNKAELSDLRAELAKTKSEKDAIETKMNQAVQARDQLQKKVDELTTSRDQLQAKVTELEKLPAQVQTLTQVGNDLQKQNVQLAKSRDAAAAEAQAAKLRIDELAKKLEAETQKVRVLQDQLKQVQNAIAELQSTFKQ